MDRGAWQATVHGVTRVGHNLSTEHHCISHFWFSNSFLYELTTQKEENFGQHLPFFTVESHDTYLECNHKNSPIWCL